MKKITKIVALCLAILTFACLFGCDKKEDYSNVENPVATIVVKGYGTMVAELYPNIAPNTVKNFIYLANSGFYDGLTFHRVKKNFMIQAGCPNGDGTGGPGYTIKGEFTNNGFQNDLKHTRGVLSMARRGSTNTAQDKLCYDTGGSQFFIMHVDYPYLDENYATFGKVIEGLDVLDAIATTATNSSNKPLTSVVIESIKVDTKGVTYGEPERITE